MRHRPQVTSPKNSDGKKLHAVDFWTWSSGYGQTCGLRAAGVCRSSRRLGVGAPGLRFFRRGGLSTTPASRWPRSRRSSVNRARHRHAVFTDSTRISLHAHTDPSSRRATAASAATGRAIGSMRFVRAMGVLLRSQRFYFERYRRRSRSRDNQCRKYSALRGGVLRADRRAFHAAPCTRVGTCPRWLRARRFL